MKIKMWEVSLKRGRQAEGGREEGGDGGREEGTSFTSQLLRSSSSPKIKALVASPCSKNLVKKKKAQT